MNTEKTTTPHLGYRLLSMLIDHVSMSIVMGIPMMLLFMLFMVKSITQHQFPDPFQDVSGLMTGMMIVMGIVFPVYFNKDIFRGRSLGKRVFKMQVLHNKTGLAASPVRCVLRNLTQFIWPIEAFITLFSPARRLGDLIAGTRVGLYDKEQEKKPIDKLQFAGAILIGVAMIACWIFGVLYPLGLFSPHIFHPKPALHFQF